MGIALPPIHSKIEKPTRARAKRKPLDDSAPTDKKLEELYGLIEGIEIAMLTTIEADGSLTSRPMATQKPREDVESLVHGERRDAQSRRLAAAPAGERRVLQQQDSRMGVGERPRQLSRDRALIHELYAKDWKAYLGDVRRVDAPEFDASSPDR